jgi:hypothetical protein
LEVFIDFDLLISAGLIEETIFDIPRISSHLNQKYEYMFKSIILQIENFSNESITEVKKTILCVQNWHISPFVLINPDRVGLVGRSVPKALEASITLDFKKKYTTVNQ